jgi:hypothetical protein
MTPIAWTHRRFDVAQRIERGLERVAAAELLERSQGRGTNESIRIFDQRQKHVGTRWVFQLRHAVGCGGRNRFICIDKERGQDFRSRRSIEFAERQRHLLAHAGIGIRHKRRQMRNGLGVAGITELDDSNAPRGRVRDPQALGKVLQIVIGFE